MILPQDIIVTGVSGGADSVCLLLLLLKYAKSTPISIVVVHVNHGIRKEAEADSDFTRALCEKYNLPFIAKTMDIPAMAKQYGWSTEEAGRKARYALFYEVARACQQWKSSAQTSDLAKFLENNNVTDVSLFDFDSNNTDFLDDLAEKGVKIAVAHHGNDRAETLLFHLFRGTGMKGLASILPVRDCLIRPLLCLERNEIESYLKNENMSYCEDSTNAHDDYTRNRIRHHIMPYAEQEIVTGATAHINQTAQMLSEVEEYLQQQTNLVKQSCIKEASRQKVIFDVNALQKAHKVIRNRILYDVIKEMSPQHKDISAVHVEMVAKLLGQGTGKECDLPFSIRAKKSYQNLSIERCNDTLQKVPDPVLLERLDFGVERIIGFGNYKFCFSLISIEKIGKNQLEIPQNQYTKWFDYDKMGRQLVLRNRLSGDFISIKNRDTVFHKSLKDYMITEKIPRDLREEIPILAIGNEVFWLVGYRIGETGKITEETKNVLQVRVEALL